MTRTSNMLEFLKLVMPQALELVHDLYNSTNGNADDAIQNIKDRRAEIIELRRARDARIAKKHEGEH